MGGAGGGEDVRARGTDGRVGTAVTSERHGRCWVACASLGPPVGVGLSLSPCFSLVICGSCGSVPHCSCALASAAARRRAAAGGCATIRFWETVKRFYLSDQRNFDVVVSFNEKPVRLPSGGVVVVFVVFTNARDTGRAAPRPRGRECAPSSLGSAVADPIGRLSTDRPHGDDMDALRSPWWYLGNPVCLYPTLKRGEADVGLPSRARPCHFLLPP